jgi:hypothetical protein
MKTAVVERLQDLAAVAGRLAALVEADKQAELPSLPLCRAAIIADKTANELADLLETLLAQRLGPQTGG